MEDFLKDFAKKSYGRDFANKNKLNNKSVSSAFNDLEKKVILKSKTSGKNKYFYLNKDNLLIKDYLKLAEIRKKIIFLEKHKKMVEIFLNFQSEDIMGIFGSYARGTEKSDSDLDIFLIGSGNLDNIKEKGRVYNLEINIHNLSVSDFQKANIPLVKEILENHILINGFDKFFNKIIKW